ncbi:MULTISPECIES: hypothetical protein [Niveibacterium]|uniref:Uncharacterized protein n=1 Tax=Niveibacterium microcysteis TaxID=2811415 RepID=A0ABX7MCE3_9RHOO|nr:MULTISPECIES: hypothetical protein [Niveibacterium]QSI78418.1 hypothetical protein JY500_07330 [Niveibacterium microcysteis]
MGKAIERIGNITVGHVGLGGHGGGIGSVRTLVHDGDTVMVRPLGNLAVRFLGVDTPEISLPLPGSSAFVRTDHPAWEAFLSDPFAPHLPPIDLDAGLRDYIAARVGPGCATNHHRHAEAAERGLEGEIASDLASTGLTPEAFRFYVRFSREVMDSYGRLLGWINREEASDDRPPTYNHRMMLKGLALPYFIWPNVAPWRRIGALRDAVPIPGSQARIAETDNRLKQAREWFRANREAGVGVFDTEDPLRLQAFELRYLTQRKAPNRWVIDLSKADNLLIDPQRYYTVENPEDRLFVPDDYLELFLAKGWQIAR